MNSTTFIGIAILIIGASAGAGYWASQSHFVFCDELIQFNYNTYQATFAHGEVVSLGLATAPSVLWFQHPYNVSESNIGWIYMTPVSHCPA
jgi:hypothetical protein